MRRSLIIGAMSVATLASGAAVAVPAFAAPKATATVMNTNGQGLLIRKAPNRHSPVIGKLKSHQKIKITCQTVGERVQGPYVALDLWDWVEGTGYVADAWVDTGHNGRIPGIPECVKSGKPKPPAPKPTAKPTTKPTSKPTTKPQPQPAKGELVPVRQGQGQATQWHDCGPTSMVIALKALSVTPHDWNKGQRAAIMKARAEMGGGTGSTNRHQIATAMERYSGVNATTTKNYDEMIAAVKAGKPVIMGGNAGVMPYPKNMVRQNAFVSHWIVVGGYDAKTGQFIIADPVSRTSKLHRVDGATLAKFYQQSPIGGVIASR